MSGGEADAYYASRERAIGREEIRYPYETPEYWRDKFELLKSFCNRDILSQFEEAEEAQKRSKP